VRPGRSDPRQPALPPATDAARHDTEAPSG